MVHVSVSYGYGASHTLHPWSCTWRLVLRHNITRTSVCVRPLPALASPDSARSYRTTRGWGERRGAGDALAEIDAVDGSAENRNRRARRGRAAQSPHPVPGERSATVRGHKPHRQRHTVSHGSGRATLHLQHPSVTHRASVVRDIRYRRHPAAVGVRFASIHGAPAAPRREPPTPSPHARGATSPTSKSRRVTEL